MLLNEDGSNHPYERFQKKEKIYNMGNFHVSKWAFLSSLTRKYMLWEGFYHNFCTKKVLASGGFTPDPPTKRLCLPALTRGLCPLDLWGTFTPSKDLPWCHPWKMLCTVHPGNPGERKAKLLSSQTWNGYLKNCRTNYRLVCIYLNAFFMLNLTVRMEIWTSTIS